MPQKDNEDPSTSLNEQQETCVKCGFKGDLKEMQSHKCIGPDREE